MTEASIRFRAFEGCSFIKQWPAYGKTVLTIPQEHPQQGKVIAVRVDGVAQKFRCNEFNEIVINLIRLEGANVHVICLSPKSPLKLPQDCQATSPSPTPVYGLQSPARPRAGGS
jgi:hypothetical protein